ncbi:uncharacterized protein LOC111905617 [Lactuca sativa]|uniref:uncharacterized protein LOC111905617 n=1 Tax=Lactuca sativa TaxID=4236 RepID=UPI0022B0365D|nr:uncharacterized protein LOC111905617 [Lactuca sativa]
MFHVLPGDPYFPDYASVYQPISPAEHAPMQFDEFEPEEDPNEDPEEEMEEEPKDDPEEDMDEDEVIIITDSESPAPIPPSPSRSFLGFSLRRSRKTAKISVPKPVTIKYSLRSPCTKKTMEPPVSESNHENQRMTGKRTAGTFEEGQTSGAAPAFDMDIDKLSFLLEQNVRLHGQMWHISDELSNMQGQSIKTKEEMARMKQRQEQYQILQDNLCQEMDYRHNSWTYFDSRMTNVETQSQIAFSVAHGVEERHALLEEKHESLEEKHKILEEKYDDMSRSVDKFFSFDKTN